MLAVLMDLLRDPFGVSESALKTMLKIVDDEEGDNTANEIEHAVVSREITLPRGIRKIKRFFLDESLYFIDPK